MKARPIILILTASLTLAALVAVAAEETAPSPGYVEFGKLLPPASGGQFIEVNLKDNLISMVARLAEKQEPEIADLIRGVKQVRVNVIGVGDENRDSIRQTIQKVRTDLDTRGWERVVTVQEGKQDIGVYVKTRGTEAVEGLVVTVFEAEHEAILVNIVGDIRPEKVALLGERLNIEPLKKVGAALNKS